MEGRKQNINKCIRECTWNSIEMNLSFELNILHRNGIVYTFVWNLHGFLRRIHCSRSFQIKNWWAPHSDRVGLLSLEIFRFIPQYCSPKVPFTPCAGLWHFYCTWFLKLNPNKFFAFCWDFFFVCSNYIDIAISFTLSTASFLCSSFRGHFCFQRNSYVALSPTEKYFN